MNEMANQLGDKLLAAGLTVYGAAGLLGNLYAESGLNPINLENQYEKKLGFTDTSYTQAVDAGTYTNFVNDCAGYGLAQWTYWSRKAALLAFARQQGCSVGDPDMQTDFLLQELRAFPNVWRVLTSATNVRTASDIVMLEFERPADVSVSARNKRTAYGEQFLQMLDSNTVENTRLHMVVEGNTLTGLAEMYDTTVSDILAKNKTAHPEMTADLIQVGWFLEV